MENKSESSLCGLLRGGDCHIPLGWKGHLDALLMKLFTASFYSKAHTHWAPRLFPARTPHQNSAHLTSLVTSATSFLWMGTSDFALTTQLCFPKITFSNVPACSQPSLLHTLSSNRFSLVLPVLDILCRIWKIWRVVWQKRSGNPKGQILGYGVCSVRYGDWVSSKMLVSVYAVG